MSRRLALCAALVVNCRTVRTARFLLIEHTLSAIIMADRGETTVPKDPKKGEERQEGEEIFNYPGARRKSKVWDTFGFLKVKAGPPTKENLDMDHAICRLCRKSYKNKGRYTQILSLRSSYTGYQNPAGHWKMPKWHDMKFTGRAHFFIDLLENMNVVENIWKFRFRCDPAWMQKIEMKRK